MTCRIALLILVVAGLPASASAQTCGPPRVGDRARITVTSSSLPGAELVTRAPVPGAVEVVEGTIRELRQDLVVLSVDGREWRIPRRSIVSFELRCVTGGIPLVTALMSGAGVGALVGGAVGCATGVDDHLGGSWCDFDRNERRTLQWALVGAAVGAGVGAVVALATESRDWTPVDLPLRVAPTPGGRWVIQVSVPVGVD